MIFDFISLVNTPAQEVPRPAKIRLRVAAGDSVGSKCPGGELLDEDLFNLPRIQQGMQSSGYTSLHLGTQEVRILHFHDTLMGYLRG